MQHECICVLLSPLFERDLNKVSFDLCVGVFTDLGGDYSVVREPLLYKGLSSWRRLLVSNVNRPAVHPVLLTNTLQGGGGGNMCECVQTLTTQNAHTPSKHSYTPIT